MAALSQTPGSVLWADGGLYDGTAGATIVAGNVVYKDTADSDKLKLAEADSTAAKAVVCGIALNGASAGQPCRVQLSGNINVGATMTVGTAYYLHTAAGSIGPSGDLATTNYVSFLGIATTATNMKLGILNSGVQVP